MNNFNIFAHSEKYLKKKLKTFKNIKKFNKHDFAIFKNSKAIIHTI